MSITSIKNLLATLTLAVGLAIAWTGSAEAGGKAGGDYPPPGWGQTRDVHHHVYYPRYRHHYQIHPVTDPYAYRYAPRAYYPYYNSHYWAPTHVLAARKHCRLHVASPSCYRYHASWGVPRRGHHHRHWHHTTHDGHRRGH